MRVGLVSDTYTPQVNGVATVVRRIVSLLRAQAFERLQRMAEAEKHTPEEQALRLLEAVELLALPAVA